MLDDLHMVSVGDITDLEAEQKSFGTCSKGELDGCSCVVNITHFSTYTVIDYSIAYPESADSTSATPAKTPASTPTPGTPAPGISCAARGAASAMLVSMVLSLVLCAQV